MKKILVLDANQRSALASIRSLGKIKDISLYTADSCETAIGGSSKYSQEYFCHPSIIDTPKEFLSWLKSIINKYKFDMIFPMTEVSSQLLLMNPDSLKGSQIPFASYETVMTLAHKGNLVKLANTIGIPVPKSIHFTSASQVNTQEVNDFPIVIKPCVSQIWHGDAWESTTVQIAHNKSELDTFLQSSPWLKNQPFMLQEFIPGYGAGAFAIYDKGKPLAFFAHQRLREKPPQGGVSVLCKSVDLDPQLLDNSKKLLDECKWHGVAMIEYRVAEDGTAYLMEVNTRFWGSLQLAIDSGVDFPALLYKTYFESPVEPITGYKKEVRLRWLLGDLDSLYLTLRSSKFTLLEKVKSIVTFFIPRPFSTYHQVNRWDDLKPAITEIKQYWQNLRN